MGREVETKESTLDRFAKMTQIGSQIAGTLQNVQRIGQAQQALSQDQERIKLAQDHAKMQQEEWGFKKENLAEEYKQKRLETRTKAGDQLNNEIFNVLDNSAASADPKAYVDSWVSNPDNINRLAKVAQIGELPFQESDVNLLKKNMLVAAPFLKSAKSAEAKFQQALTAPDAAFDTEAAQKALAEYNAAFNGTSGILPRAISKVMQDRQDAFTKEIDAKNKRIEDSRQKGLERVKDLAVARTNANAKTSGGDSKELRLNLNTFGSRKDVVASREAFQTADQGLGLLQNNGDKNEVVGLLKLGLAKAANGGRPTDKDVELISPNPSIANKLKRWVAADFDNEALEIDANALSEVFSRMKQVQGGALQNMAKGYAKSRSKLVGVPEEDFAQQLLDEAGFGPGLQGAQGGEQKKAPISGSPRNRFLISEDRK